MTNIISTISGKVQEINIKVGDTITEDDEAVIIEAMKMETIVYGENGTVKEIFIKEGDAVEEDQLIATVE